MNLTKHLPGFNKIPTFRKSITQTSTEKRSPTAPFFMPQNRRRSFAGTPLNTRIETTGLSVNSIANSPSDYQTWHLPLKQDTLSLAEALASLKTVGAPATDIPLIVQLMENPKFKLLGLELFHGRVTLEQHDYIHLVLGRGLLPKDEAFTIGFTMGSTRLISTMEERLFSFIAQRWYPKVYSFGTEEVEVFRDAIRLGGLIRCQALDKFDFDAHLDCSLKELRQRLGLEVELLAAYYQMEKKRYPRSPESQRLV